eukprot:Nitzschia sp. Nitz4//scaffold62_size106224//63827//65719//NITZ4_004360-RA/size106224-processed-gene-0.33-mRNA-1//1//CDS//3329555868//6545//frame0
MGRPEEKLPQICWETLPVAPYNNQTSECSSIQVSNAALSVPAGLHVFPDMVSAEESQQVVNLADTGTPVWDGFEQRRRIQCWNVSDPELPPLLFQLARRFEETTGKQPLHVSLQEYPINQLLHIFNPKKSIVTTFETKSRCTCTSSQECSCFVATLPVASNLLESINRPKERRPDCWDLYSLDNHSSGLILHQGAFYLKTDESLWEWRSRITSLAPQSDGNPGADLPNARAVLLRFSRVAGSEGLAGEEEDSEFGYIPKPEDFLPKEGNMPPLEEMLTIVVTTSPIKSNPSTELFERVFETFFHGGNDFALRCRKLIICDGCREKNENVSKRHSNVKQAMRNGIVDSDQLRNYIAFKEALRMLCSTAPPESPFATAEVEELDARHGYGFALRHALRECVKTPYVIVIQHDRTFMRSCPIAETVETMWRHANIKYVGISMRTNLMYRDMFLSKYGRSYMDAMARCTLRPPELQLDSSLYGPDSASTNSMDFAGQEKLRENILSLSETYQTSQQNKDYLEWISSHELPHGKCQLSLTPTFFWYDNVHICETSHYRDFVFNPKYKMVVRGGFVEDKLSPVIRKTVERFGLAKGHERFGCFLLDDHSGMFFTGHLDGGSYLTKAEKEAMASNSK